MTPLLTTSDMQWIGKPALTGMCIKQAVKKIGVELDKLNVARKQGSTDATALRVDTARSGCCAVFGVYLHQATPPPSASQASSHLDRRLIVANIGDSRAVIGRQINIPSHSSNSTTSNNSSSSGHSTSSPSSAPPLSPSPSSSSSSSTSSSSSSSSSVTKAPPSPSPSADPSTPTEPLSAAELSLELLVTCIPLSTDHKPGRADERARIEKSGGRVGITGPGQPHRVFQAGSLALYPGLAVSRAIGDVWTQQLGVISVPDIVEHKIDDSGIVSMHPYIYIHIYI